MKESLRETILSAYNTYKRGAVVCFVTPYNYIDPSGMCVCLLGEPNVNHRMFRSCHMQFSMPNTSTICVKFMGGLYSSRFDSLRREAGGGNTCMK